MCGIAGIVRFDDQPIDRLRAESMLSQMLHRGPDGRGISEHDRCTLAHARLSIIDQAGGAQPMHHPQTASHGPLQVVFNGEIYNHRELRKELQQRGHSFTSDHSDTETLLLGYREWGHFLPAHLRGMFAFAIWDESQRSLYLARDQTGKKPLYLRQTRDELIFASLPATITAGATERIEHDPQALLTFLRFGYPFGTSMLQGVSELKPGHWLAVDAEGDVTSQCYWRPPATSDVTLSKDLSDAPDQVERVLDDAVSARLESDVPLGCFLSGGIDSSLIAAYAQRTLKRRGADPLKTFSVSTADTDFDEGPHARAIAEHIGSDHTELRADPSDLIDDLRQLMQNVGEPTADSGMLPSYWLCKVARPHIKVALTGDGGDELFGGYDRYRALGMIARHRWWLRAVPRGLIHSSSGRSRRAKLRRLLDAASAGPCPSAQYVRMVQLFDDAQVRMLAPGLTSEFECDTMPDWPSDPDSIRAAMRWDQTHYLPHDLLRKVDRSSMSMALELRCPMLDTRVMELAVQLPRSVLMPGGQAKGLLRTLAARHLPESISRLPKRGFSVPIGRWFRENLKDALKDRLTDGTLDRLGIDQAQVNQYFDQHTTGRADHSHRLFSMLQLSLWGAWLGGCEK
jgi:asparagine synthase (glutamine-hydrolysing)